MTAASNRGAAWTRAKIPHGHRHGVRLLRAWGIALRFLLVGVTLGLLSLGLLSVAGQAAEPGAPPQRAPAPLPIWHLELHLDPATGELQGNSLLAPVPVGVQELLLHPDLELTGAWVDLSGATAWDPASIAPGTVAGTVLSTSLEPLAVEAFGNGRYRVAIPPSATALHLTWHGRLPAVARTDSAFLRPEGGFLPSHSRWYPDGLPGLDRDTYLTVYTPPGYLSVADGSFRAGTTPGSAHFHHPQTRRIDLAIGPWVERSRHAGEVLLRTLFPAALDQRHAEDFLEAAAGYLSLFQQHLGPYPYHSFTMAASPLPVGLAFSGWTWLGEVILPLPFLIQTSLAHELLHNWWGTGVRVHYPSGNWSEGLTTYLADHFLAEQRGEDRIMRQRWVLELAWLPPALDQPLHHFRSGNQGIDRLIGYHRAALFFHMLRQRMGDSAFFAGLQALRTQFMFREASWQDLETVFSAAAQQNLAAFFAAWVQRPGLPEVRWQSFTVQPVPEKGWLLEFTLEQHTDLPRPMRLPVVIETAIAPPQRHWVTLEQSRQSYQLMLAYRPTALDIDPDFEVLRQWPDPPMIFRAITLDPEVRWLNLQPGLDDSLAHWLGHPPGHTGHTGHSREVTAATDPVTSVGPWTGTHDWRADMPLVVAGRTTAVQDWLQSRPEIPWESGRTAQAAVHGMEVVSPIERRGQARAWTLPGTRTLLLSADTPASLQRLLNSLRHYGHRSYLVLDPPSPPESGLWASATSSLRVIVPPLSKDD